MNKFKKNLKIAFITQIVSAMTSIIVSLLLPKVLGINGYAYYQLLLLGISYIGLLHFGLSDGVYLKYGGEDYLNLDYSRLSYFFWMMLIWLITISFFACFIIKFSLNDSVRVFVWQIVFIYGIIANASWYLGYIFQASNNTIWYSISILIFKLIILITYLFLIFHKQTDVSKYIVIYIIAQLVSFIYCAYLGRKVLFGFNLLTHHHYFKDLVHTCMIGGYLTISNVSNTLILGIGRIIVDRKWNLLSFGKVSLAISLTNFLMQFMQQISMVLFPALRQSSKEYQNELFNVLNDSLGIVLGAFFVMYYPLVALLNRWLPQYHDSFIYLGILMPICCYDGKVFILYNTYMKVLRKEKTILKVNVLSCFVCLCLCLMFSFVFNNINSVVYGMVISIGIRNMALGYILSAKKKDFLITFSIETALSLIFVNLVIRGVDSFSLCFYGISYLSAILFRRDAFYKLIHFLYVSSKNRNIE